MKSIRLTFKWVLAILFCGFYLIACESGHEDIPNDPSTGFRFVMSLPDEMAVESKAVTLGSDDDPVTINDVWILQYTGDTEDPLRSVHLTTGFTNDETYKGFVTLTTPDKSFRLVSSRFYIIVNGGDGLFDDSDYTSTEGKARVLSITEANLKAKTVSLLNASNQLPTITEHPVFDLLTAGPVSYTPSGTESDKVIFISSLTRTYSKVSLQVNLTPPATSTLTPAFDIKNVVVTNLPNIMSLYTQEAATYPTPSDIVEGNIDINTASNQITVGSGTPISFYMAENRRGMGTSSSSEYKNLPANGPGGSLAGCTCLTLKGIYKYGIGHTSGIDVEYKFYLGDNMISDYNIQRNYHYNLTINITGPNSADYRVKIMNGNVAIFDEVDTVSNEVIF